MKISKNDDDGNGKLKPLFSTFNVFLSKCRRPLFFVVCGIAMIFNMTTWTSSSSITATAPPGGEMLLMANSDDPSLRGSESTNISPADPEPKVADSENEVPPSFLPELNSENPNSAASSPPKLNQEAPEYSTNMLSQPALDERSNQDPSMTANTLITTTNSNFQDPNNAYAEISIPENNIQGPVNAEPSLEIPESNQQSDPSFEMPQNIQQKPQNTSPPINDSVNANNALPMPEANPQNNNDAAVPLPAMPETNQQQQQHPENAGPPFTTPHSSLQNTKEEQEIETTSRTLDNLRYLTLGSSVTWGAGMEARQFAYPYLLTQDRTHISNLAVRAAGPKYPSVCIQSMVSEESTNPNFSEDYDVIILEYYMRGYDGLYDLAQRLRRRYPDAIIILLRLWQPVHIGWYENNEMKGTLYDWAIPKKFFLESNTIAQAVKNTKVDLRWPDPTSHNAVQNQVMTDFGAHLYEMEKPRDPKDAIVQYRDRFAKDFNHLNEKGHAIVAEEIQKIVARELPSYPKEPRRGDWGDGDSCHSWYQSGQVQLQYSLSVVIEEYDTANAKFALSTGVSNPSGHGWVIVDNPFDTPRNLILSYLATGPPPSIYPKTEITVHPENDESTILSQMVLNPVTTDYEHKVHIVLTTKVSVVMPGRSVVKWRPLEDTGKPFRLTATAVVGRDVEEGGILGAIKDFTFFG